MRHRSAHRPSSQPRNGIPQGQTNRPNDRPCALAQPSEKSLPNRVGLTITRTTRRPGEQGEGRRPGTEGTGPLRVTACYGTELSSFWRGREFVKPYFFIPPPHPSSLSGAAGNRTKPLRNARLARTSGNVRRPMRSSRLGGYCWLNILRCPGQPPTKNPPAPNAHSAEADSPRLPEPGSPIWAL